MNNKISNHKTEIPLNKELNDMDYINILLESEKNLTNNLNTCLNEASNEILFTKLNEIYNTIRLFQRKIFETSFSLGWYELEKANQTKIDDKSSTNKTKLSEL